ncbi:MAG: hypothetical protein GF329_14725 [Candidatus Lokiarchaeota archaeon]|nr:hypothetical protein [Candidatus Lokiarchaeota archaeon]
MIEIKDLWAKDVKKISKLINKLHKMHDKVGVEKEVEKLIGFFYQPIPKKKKKEKELYFLQWSAYKTLLAIIKSNNEYVADFKKDLIRLSRNSNKNISERARDLIKKGNIKIGNEKCLYLQLSDFKELIIDKNKIDIKEISESLQINDDEALDWIKQLIEEKKIDAYISNERVHLTNT